MKNNRSSMIEFDILLRSAASGEMPDISNIGQFHPDLEDIEKCRRWLASKGITCYSTAFGLACSAPVALFETLFCTKVQQGDSAPGMPPGRCSSPPKAPPEIEKYVDQISISAQPEFF